VPAEGAAHRDSHELRDLATVAVGEDAWVVLHGVLADTPPDAPGTREAARVGSHPEASLMQSLSSSPEVIRLYLLVGSVFPVQILVV
jgi:hypothetical protein